MRLRKQLILLSLVTLALPWAGCQYLRELQHTIELGQAQALSATAKAIAARIQSDPETLQELKQRYTNNNTESLFSHRLKTAPIIDGYDEEWRAQSLKPLDIKYKNYPSPLKTVKICDSYLNANNQDPNNTHCANTQITKNLEDNSENQFSAQVITGLFNNKLNLFIYIKDEEIRYFNPTLLHKNNKDSSSKHNSNFLYDNIKLFVKKGNQTRGLQTYQLYAAGPGNLRASTFHQNAQRLEHQIKGKWLENSSGYQVELEMPAAWANNGLLIEVHNAEAKMSLSTAVKHSAELAENDSSFKGIEEGNTPNNVPPLITQSVVLDRALSVFLRDDLSLYITNPQYFFIGRSESIKNASDTSLPWFLRVIYQSILESSNDQLLMPNTTISRSGISKTLTAKEAITLDDKTLGFVNVEQHSDSLSSATNNAFSRLILYSMITTLIVAIALIFYASWLSFRIRSLSKAAQKAVSEKGTISADFPVFMVKDEVSELSDSYAELLDRLHEYTRYLQTLSSKLSHELRTPLAIVTSSLDNLSLSNLDTEAETYAQRAHTGAKRLSSILTAMSSASRIEQVIESAEAIEFDLMDILPDLIEAYRSAYPNIKLVLDTPDQATHLKMTGVPELIVQLLDKLVDNAADFSSHGSEVLIKAEHQNTFISLTVTNRGPLLPEHMKAQLFDSLVSLRGQTPNEANTNTTISNDSASSKQLSHLGLGLFIVRLISGFHGGDVRADNLNDGSGVIFTVLLPALRSSGPPDRPKDLAGSEQ